jgi:hypothetical protein
MWLAEFKCVVEMREADHSPFDIGPPGEMASRLTTIRESFGPYQMPDSARTALVPRCCAVVYDCVFAEWSQSVVAYVVLAAVAVGHPP